MFNEAEPITQKATQPVPMKCVPGNPDDEAVEEVASECVPPDEVAVVAAEAVEDVPVEPVAVRTKESRLSPEEERIRACEEAIGYTFFNKSLIRNALTHSSSTSDKRMDNERMEFFGDAVLDLVVREHLYRNYPNRQEGDLTEAKSAVVCRTSLVGAAKRIGLKKFLFLGRGMGRRRPVPESLLGDAFEAIVAAIYLDGGYQPVKNFILFTLGQDIPGAVEQVNSTNYKSTLQKLLQQAKRPLPVYRVLDATGPEHSRVFHVAVLVEGQEMGRGSGSSKKAAEQQAARSALADYESPDAP